MAIYRNFKSEEAFLNWVYNNNENEIYAVYKDDDIYDDDSYICDIREKELILLEKDGYLEFCDDGTPYLSAKDGAYNMVWKNRCVISYPNSNN